MLLSRSKFWWACNHVTMLLKLQLFSSTGRKFLKWTGRDVTRQQQGLYVNVCQVGPVRMKRRLIAIPYTRCNGALQWMLHTQKQPDGFWVRLIDRDVFSKNISTADCCTRGWIKIEWDVNSSQSRRESIHRSTCDTNIHFRQQTLPSPLKRALKLSLQLAMSHVSDSETMVRRHAGLWEPLLFFLLVSAIVSVIILSVCYCVFSFAVDLQTIKADEHPSGGVILLEVALFTDLSFPTVTLCSLKTIKI